MSLYSECADIYAEYVEPYYYNGDYDLEFMPKMRQLAAKAVVEYVKKNYPDTPTTYCKTCVGIYPYTKIDYDSGVVADVCLVCGYGVIPFEGKQ